MHDLDNVAPLDYIALYEWETPNLEAGPPFFLSRRAGCQSSRRLDGNADVAHNERALARRAHHGERDDALCVFPLAMVAGGGLSLPKRRELNMGYAIPHGVDAVTALRVEVERLDARKHALISAGPVTFAGDIARLEDEAQKVERLIQVLPAVQLVIDG